MQLIISLSTVSTLVQFIIVSFFHSCFCFFLIFSLAENNIIMYIRIPIHTKADINTYVHEHIYILMNEKWKQRLSIHMLCITNIALPVFIWHNPEHRGEHILQVSFIAENNISSQNVITENILRRLMLHHFSYINRNRKIYISFGYFCLTGNELETHIIHISIHWMTYSHKRMSNISKYSYAY